MNIIEEIMKSPKYNQQMDLDREDYYEIELKFDGLTLVSMKINGWEIISINPEV
ncbi:FimB/Mfa2 family fimbrial subunit [Bacteroides fragilis]|nr:FimB/Mfa2 family fimbrial subunit [Bacteroides fragilis]MCS2922150.1 FimB/Mfa2 family fimbrial subunit [Bacteroides fragilis]UVV77613.1 FimB/Mfa2 family fimbrial subunit [Bacteroides fragilis]